MEPPQKTKLTKDFVPLATSLYIHSYTHTDIHAYLQADRYMSKNVHDIEVVLRRVAIVLDSDRNNWMTILSPGADGLCNRTSRSPVLFNEGLRSGCFVT